MGCVAKTVYEYNGDIMSLYGFSRKYNINLGTLTRRIVDKGMSMEDALHLPIRRYDSSSIIGKKFGKLTVLERSNYTYSDGKHMYKCLCDCGNISYPTRESLTKGLTRSCGCLRKGNGKSKVGKKDSN